MSYWTERRSEPYYESFRALPKPPSEPKGAPKLVEGLFFSLIPPLSKSTCTLSSRVISLERGAVADVVGLRALEENSEASARVVGGEKGCSSLSLRRMLSIVHTSK